MLAAFREGQLVVDTTVVDRVVTVESHVGKLSKWSSGVDNQWRASDKYYTKELDNLRHSVDTLLEKQHEADEDSDNLCEHNANFGSDRNKIVATMRFGGINAKGEYSWSNKFVFKGCTYRSTLGNVAKWMGEDQELLMHRLVEKRTGHEGGIIRYKIVAFFDTASLMVVGIGVTSEDISGTGGQFLFARSKEPGRRSIHKDCTPKDMVTAWKEASFSSKTQFMVKSSEASAAAAESVSVHTREEVPVMRTFSLCEKVQ